VRLGSHCRVRRPPIPEFRGEPEGALARAGTPSRRATPFASIGAPAIAQMPIVCNLKKSSSAPTLKWVGAYGAPALAQVDALAEVGGLRIRSRERRRPLAPRLVELRRDERAATVTGFPDRALVFYTPHGVRARRPMIDNAFACVKNRSPRELLAREGSAI
jgi:hypothetical protein